MSTPRNDPLIPVPPLWIPLIPIAFLLASMGITILVFGKDPHIPLALTAIVTALVARLNGAPWSALEKGMLHGIAVGTKAIIILMVIGMLIALRARTPRPKEVRAEGAAVP